MLFCRVHVGRLNSMLELSRNISGFHDYSTLKYAVMTLVSGVLVNLAS